MRAERTMDRARRGRVITVEAILVILLISGLAAAALYVFTQRAPPVPAVTNVLSNCAATVATPAVVPIGTDGDITLSCSGSDPAGNPAFTTNATILIKPVVTGFSSPYTTLWVYDADGAVNTGNCSFRTAAQFITSGDPDTYPAGGWNYCATYHDVGAAGLAAFTVDWYAG